MYAELIGNYKKYWIKSQYGNKLQGKTWITALFCVVRCILYPGTKIVVCSGTKSQALEVLLKITDDFCKSNGWGSANLNNEIAFKSTAVNNPVIEFKNGSWIKVRTSTDNARGKYFAVSNEIDK